MTIALRHNGRRSARWLVLRSKESTLVHRAYADPGSIWFGRSASLDATGATWEVDLVWRLVGKAKRCRMLLHQTDAIRCLGSAVAEIKRGNQWWPYCPEHLYGRRVADGRVWRKA